MIQRRLLSNVGVTELLCKSIRRDLPQRRAFLHVAKQLATGSLAAACLEGIGYPTVLLSQRSMLFELGPHDRIDSPPIEASRHVVQHHLPSVIQLPAHLGEVVPEHVE